MKADSKRKVAQAHYRERKAPAKVVAAVKWNEGKRKLVLRRVRKKAKPVKKRRSLLLVKRMVRGHIEKLEKMGWQDAEALAALWREAYTQAFGKIKTVKRK